ncbi:hypothetical protein [uncultured Draconibacterium sp.]|uniref:hypothetical protein n=1 Tax=uncultured Draconibacterium sp. TaxID=1573823 RepID=UPI0025CD3420|nr:hypothetical protein [uncultured Draconibacterium sp.]
MELKINKKLRSGTLLHTACRLSVSENDLWEMFFESGCIYLEDLAEQIKRKRVFDALFKAFLNSPEFGEMLPCEVFNKIRFSPAFWFWWSVHFEMTCQNEFIESKQDLGNNLAMIDALIPNFILKQIFYGKQKPECRQRAAGVPACKTTTVRATPGKVRKEVGSGI